jgi:two-component system alkaline phosphatase synthesis response regulator PhoP
MNLTLPGMREQPLAVSRKVMIVNGSGEILEMFESILDPGHYDVVFVESSDHAYSQIRVLQPNLVILCVRLDDVDGLQVLSMLKLDEETSKIPVLTYTTEFEGQSVEGARAERPDHDLFAMHAAMPMN